MTCALLLAGLGCAKPIGAGRSLVGRTNLRRYEGPCGLELPLHRYPHVGRRIPSGSGSSARSRHDLVVVPLTKLSGLESLELRGRAGGAYLSLAWQARDKAGGERGGVPWDSAGMAINSAANRTQDQLHIHVDCLTPEAKASLAKATPSLGEGWKLLWRGVWARFVLSEDLGAVDALGPSLNKLPLGPAGLARLNFAVAGAERAGGQKGFVLLTSATSSFERLLDAGCAVLQPNNRRVTRQP